MPPNTFSTTPITITQSEARRFMLSHHGLFPPRKLNGKNGILEYIQHVGSIQFDPINIVGRNPDLVLQSRVKDYQPTMLDDLLYQERKLLDGWDKMASIYSMEDWPYFLRRKKSIKNNPHPRRPSENVLEYVQEEISKRGPLSSLDIKGTEKIDWSWGPTKAARAALEQLYAEGVFGVHHRVNNRRSFDLINRLVPASLLDQSDPFKTDQEYHHWHILRRVGSMGLVNSRAGEYWYGILGIKSKERNQIINRLLEKGSLISIHIPEKPGQTFFIRQQDMATLESIQSSQRLSEAAIIAALDNLIWNRGLVQQIFNFEYVWEVYKPKSQRKFGYYVLPVLYADRFVARFEPKFDKKKRILTINNWWWETGIHPDSSMKEALSQCLNDFLVYLDADHLEFSDSTKNLDGLGWAYSLEK